MKYRWVIAQLFGFLVSMPGVMLAQEGPVVSGKVSTLRHTALKAEPTAPASAARVLDPDTELRWIMGEQSGKYLRVTVPKGPMGWVLASDVQTIAPPDMSAMTLAASAQPCIEPQTLVDCTTSKPFGCSPPGSAHALVNQLKRTVPPAGDSTMITFDTFSQLQSRAVELVDQGVEIEPAEREQIKALDTTEGTIGEGSLVRLMAFLSEGKPHPNNGESVNCNLKNEENNDIHIAVSETKSGSEFDSICAEMIPQGRTSAWSAKNVEKLRGKLLLIEGGLFYDNLHVPNNDPKHPLGGQPKRFSLWEIHPVVSVKVCQKPAGQCDPNRADDWKAF